MNNLKEARIIVLDFDDTLCLTEFNCYRIENRVAKEMGHPPMSRRIHQHNWGLPIEEAIIERIPGIDPVEFIKCFALEIPKAVMEGRLDNIPRENLDVLDKLLTAGKQLAVLTSRTQAELTHLLEPDHHLSTRIKRFYYKGNLPYLKPDPRAFNSIFEDFGVTPEQVVYVGDTLKDAIASKAAGTLFVAVLESGLRKKIDFKGVQVDAFAKKFTDLTDILT